MHFMFCDPEPLSNSMTLYGIFDNVIAAACMIQLLKQSIFILNQHLHQNLLQYLMDYIVNLFIIITHLFIQS